MLAMFIVISFALVSNAATIKKKSETATQNVDNKASVQPKANVDKTMTNKNKGNIPSKDYKSTQLPVSTEAKDREALAEQTKQKQREAERRKHK